MTVTKRSVSFSPEVWGEVARIMGDGGAQLSPLVNAALTHYLHLKRSLEAARAWEAEFGPLTLEERAEADRLLDGADVSLSPAPWQG
ncbi:MAG: hypothetical protein HW416_1736 [Chloroflexi bacterium]|nr:hypothetical protein [Chloroflexota bacterium]